MSLKDKASKLDFSALPTRGAAKQGDAFALPKTAPGAMMAFANGARSELLLENDQLKAQAVQAEVTKVRLDEALQDLAQWDGAKAARPLDPRQIMRSRFANRHELNFLGPVFEALKREISEAGGNVQPVKVRTLSAEPGHYELVFGHRRVQACLELGIPVLALIDNVDDRTLFVEMDRENRGRKDLSAWEQGVMYKRAIDEGLFPSNRRLAEALGVDLSALGKAIELASLDSVLVGAFSSPLDLQFRWSKALRNAWDSDPKGMREVAVDLSKRVPRPSAKGIFELLTTPKGKGVEPFHPLTAVVLKVRGNKVAQLVTMKDGSVTVTFNPGVVTAARQNSLARTIEEFLANPEQR